MCIKPFNLQRSGLLDHGSLWTIRDFEAGGGMGYLCASLATGRLWMFYAGAFEEEPTCPSSDS